MDDPELPPLEDDRVAMMLGLVPISEPPRSAYGTRFARMANR
jgi:hypothetical protein